MGSLNQSQINLRTPHQIKQQLQMVETAAMQLSVENIKLQHLEYRLKLDELKSEMQTIMSMKIKYVPASDQIMKYIMPNMLKRRFHTSIIPKVTEEIRNMVKTLNDQLNLTQERPIHKSINLQHKNEEPMEIHSPTESSVPCSSSTMNFKTPMNVDMNLVKQTLKRKNNTVDLDSSSSSTIHEDSHNKRKTLIRSASHSSIKSYSSYNTDIGEVWTAKTSPSTSHSNLHAPPNQQNMQVHTIHESYENYTTLLINKEMIPTISNPPDTPIKIMVKENMELHEKDNMINHSNNVAMKSLPHHGLITIVSRLQSLKLPPTHLVIEFPQTVPTNQLQSLSSENIIFEILLVDHDFLIYKRHLQEIVEWCKTQCSPTIVTLPSHWENQLREHLCSETLNKIQRPFHMTPYPSNTT